MPLTLFSKEPSIPVIPDIRPLMMFLPISISQLPASASRFLIVVGRFLNQVTTVLIPFFTEVIAPSNHPLNLPGSDPNHDRTDSTVFTPSWKKPLMSFQYLVTSATTRPR